jgi:ABC-type nitrate/sulfonate/bicarbonate transport system substrate-binding protein
MKTFILRSGWRPLFLAGAIFLAAALAAPSAARAQAKEIRVGHIPIGVVESSTAVLIGAKMAEMLGIKVTLSTFNAGSAVATALISGEIDFGTFGDVPFLSAVARAPGRIVALNPCSLSYWTTTIVARNDTPYKSIKDLAGKKLAVPVGSVTHVWVSQLLRTAGMTDKDVNIISMVARDAVPALKAGQIDVFAWGNLTGLQAEEEGWGKNVFWTFDAKGEGAFKNGMFMATTHAGRRAFLDQNPKLSQAWEDIFITAQQFIMDHVVAASAVYAKEGGVSLKLAVEAMLLVPPYPYNENHFVGMLEQFGKSLRDSGLVKNVPEDSKVYIDDSFAQNSRKRGIEFKHPAPLYPERGKLPGSKIDWNEANVSLDKLLQPYVDDLKKKGTADLLK